MAEYFCTTTADCAEITDGCCLSHIVDSVAPDSMWSELMPEVVPGVQEAMCVSAAW